MSDNIVYADTVGVDGTVYPTIGENIRNSNLLMKPKELITVKITIKTGENLITDNNTVKGGDKYLFVTNRDLFLISVIKKNVTSPITENFLRTTLAFNHLAIKIRDDITSEMTGDITLLLGVV